MKNNEFILYGLDRHKEVIDEIIYELNASHESFDIRLILTEALTNAFKHGNNSMKGKPIFLRYKSDGGNVRFEIEDCGDGFENTKIEEQALAEDLLNDSGRGLFLINCVSDKVEINNNALIIEKQIN